MFNCVRVYNNGDIVRTNEADVEAWVKYNETYRFGCALFVDGVCRYEGYLNHERCLEISKLISGLKPGQHLPSNVGTK